MTDATLPPRERMDLLLADRALFGISAQESAELQRLLTEFPDVDPESLDRTAAVAELAFRPVACQPMPANVYAKLRLSFPAANGSVF